MCKFGLHRSLQCQTTSQDTLLLVPIGSFTHACAIGETGSGKTTGFIYPNLNQRIQEGHGILLFDYKGKEHLAVKALAARHGRLEDVVEIGKPWGEPTNLIEHFSDDNLSNVFMAIFKSADAFWGNFATSTAQAIVRAAKAIAQFEKLCAARQIQLAIAPAVSHPIAHTFGCLADVSASRKSFGEFYDSMRALLDTLQAMKVKHFILQAQDMPDAIAIVEASRIFKETIRILASSANTLKSLREEAQQKVELTTRMLSNFINMMRALDEIARRTPWNTPDTQTIAQMLEAGKIVVLDVASIPQAILPFFAQGIFNTLVRTRSISQSCPITIFIDEAQKVITEATDLHADVLREAKVELLLSFQNSNLMVAHMGKNAYYALMGNITQRYHFKNSVFDEVLMGAPDCSTLASHTCYGPNTKIRTAQPLYLASKELDAAELAYQQSRGILNRYAAGKPGGIVCYDTSSASYRFKRLCDGTYHPLIVRSKQEQWIAGNFLTVWKRHHLFEAASRPTRMEEEEELIVLETQDDILP